MFDKPVNITKVYGSSEVNRIPKKQGLRRKKETDKEVSTIIIPKGNGMIKESQLRKIYALQKNLGLEITWNDKLTRKEGELEIQKLLRWMKVEGKR